MGDVAAHFGHSALSKVTFLPNRDHTFAIGGVKCKMDGMHYHKLMFSAFIAHAVQLNLTSTLHRVIVGIT